jgi:outer membrane protein TolC
MKTLLSLGLLLLATITHAQEFKLSMQEAVALGLKNKVSLKNQGISVQLAENEEAKIRTRNLPQITATFDARINTQLQTQVISPQAVGGAAGSDPIRAQFGTRYFNVFAINASQNLFSPAVRYDKRINRERTVLEQLNLEKEQTDAILAISTSYLDAAFKQVKADASRYNLQLAHEKHQMAQVRFAQGTQLKTALDRERLNELNAKQTYRNDSSQYVLALRSLANELALPSGASIQLTELSLSADVEPSIESDPGNRVEFRAEMQQLNLHQLNKSKQQSSYAPVISLFGNYTVQQFNQSFDPTDGRFWTPYNYIGLRMEIPVFDGLLKEKNKAEFTLRAEQSKNNIDQLRRQIEYEVSTAQWEYHQSRETLELAQENYALAQEIVKTDRARMEAGAILEAEAKDSEYALMNSQNNYLDSLYQYLLAKLRLQKASGILNK